MVGPPADRSAMPATRVKVVSWLLWSSLESSHFALTTANNPWKPWPAALQDDLETVLDPTFNGESDGDLERSISRPLSRNLDV